MKVSVITIVYNNQESIVNALQSVLDQTYNDIEHIVIDGGSIDGTQSKIKPFENKLAHFISEKDKGLYDALNRGIKLATGDVVGVLHSDDFYFNKEVLENVVATFKESKADLVYGNGMYVDKQKTKRVKRIYRSKTFKKKYLFSGWIPLHTTIYVKRELFEKYGYYDEQYNIASDYDISLRWFKEPELKKVFLDKWFVVMRLGGKSTTLALQNKKSIQDFKIIKKHNLLGFFTLACKISRKIPQYIVPIFRGVK